MQETQRKKVIDRLRYYDVSIQRLIGLIAGESYLSCDDKDTARELMKALKADLVQDSKPQASASGDGLPNHFDRAYFHPAVQGASCQIRARWNSDPLRSDWLSELYAARIDIGHYLHALERRS
jgi:hypothetical protein